ncbi:MAG: hypothetical protein HKN43_14190 [Rhodothermales bacterium]|nr:hypothetical protein [Rhodothermales bacterium]
MSATIDWKYSPRLIASILATVLMIMVTVPVEGQYSRESIVDEVTQDEYLAYIVGAADDGWEALENNRRSWVENIDLDYVFGYNPPSNDLYLAALSANVFRINGDRKYLDRARQLLTYYRNYRDFYPADFHTTKAEYGDELPAIPNIFTFGKFVHAFSILLENDAIAEGDEALIREDLAASADYLVNFQEWGPMNRAMLRAEAMTYVAAVMPEHPRQKIWKMAGEAIADDNWGQWEIEDATGYHAIWLYSLAGYASNVRQDESLYRTPVMQYYFDYFLKLISPAGLIPDFGDAGWGASWTRMIPIFEKAAAINKDPRFRWAAAQYYRTYLDPAPERKSYFTALCLSDAYLWADFSLGAEVPTSGSQEVLEDIVGKKVVFRDGWDANSTYMLYNYRDEGEGGWLFREYLRTTIPVEEEKMHHGHSDENSIVMLMKNNSVLLHDGGYRDYMPSGPYGAFRADYFHNRVVVRNGKIAWGQDDGEFRYASPGYEAVEGQQLLDFMRNSGAYHQVETRKIDFLTLDHFDMTRTRIIDDRLGYEADRIVNYVKELDWFVVFDVVRFTEPGYLTMANMWHTRDILQQGDGWYDTAYDSLRNVDVAGSERLLVVFPENAQLEEGTGEQDRYWQKEKFIYQAAGRHGYRNDLQKFVTILIPHDASADPNELAASVSMLDVDRPDQAVAVEINYRDKKYTVGAKLDMEYELFRDWRRPMYNYESGKVSYGEYETDAYHLFVVEDDETLHFAVSGVVKIKKGDRVLHEQFPAEFGLAFDGSPDKPGIGKLRYWEEEVEK